MVQALYLKKMTNITAIMSTATATGTTYISTLGSVGRQTELMHEFLSCFKWESIDPKPQFLKSDLNKHSTSMMDRDLMSHTRRSKASEIFN